VKDLNCELNLVVDLVKLIEHFLQSYSAFYVGLCFKLFWEIYLHIYASFLTPKLQWEFWWLCPVQKLHWKFWWLGVCAYKVVARVLVALHLRIQIKQWIFGGSIVCWCNP
jgi:hypothetical protein